MKKFSLIVFILLSTNLVIIAQGNVGVGTTTPDASAALEISSTNKGVLIPRMTTAQRDAIVSPAVGLMILNLDDKCTDVFNGTTWIKNCGFSVAIDSVTGGWWQRKNDFGGIGRFSAVGFTIGSKGYVGTGIVEGPFVTKDFWEYDPAADSWTQKSDFGGTSRFNAVGFSIGNKGYVGTGREGDFMVRKDFWEYDPLTNSWTQKADFGGVARYAATCFAIGNKGYVGTGADQDFVSKKDFWEYDPATDTWLEKAEYGGLETFYAVGFSIAGKGYIGTGANENISAPTNEFWEYDPITNHWTQKADVGGPDRAAAVGFSIGNKGYIGIGEDIAINPLKDFWEYDPLADSWIQKPDFLGTIRQKAVGFSIGSKGFVGLGISPLSITEKDIWQFDRTNSSYSDNVNNSDYINFQNGLWDKYRDTIRNISNTKQLSLKGNFHLTGRQKIDSTYTLEFGAGRPGKQKDAGKIGYQSFSNSLDIVGAGTSLTNRKIRFWAEGGSVFTGKVDINNSSILEFGASIADKEVNAGKIGYQAFSPDALDIIGAGTLPSNRKINFLAEGGATFSNAVNMATLNVNENANVSGNATFYGNVGIGTPSPLAQLHLRGYQKIDSSFTLEFGAGMAGKESNSGMIGYQTFSDALDIVGAGTLTTNRKIMFHAAGGATFTGSVNAASLTVTGVASVSGNALFNGNVGIGTISPTAKLHLRGYQKIDSTFTLEFGAGVIGKQANAGKIGYKTFSDALDIVGAGTTPGNRRIKLWDKIIVPDTAFFFGVLNCSNKVNFNETLSVNDRIRVFGNYPLEMGANVPNKETNAGKIGYETFTPGALDIVGAGTTASNRKVKIHAEGGVEITGQIVGEDWTWLPLQNGWFDYGGGFTNAAYYKDHEGVVHLRGLITGGPNVQNTVMANLPVGYRPTYGTMIFAVVNGVNTTGRVDVLTNGNVIFQGTTNTFLSLDQISFRTY